VRQKDRPRTLAIRDNSVNVKTIKTTDEHPFYVGDRAGLTPVNSNAA
jgi:hypothetical protein